MNILVTGADGQLANCMHNVTSSDYEKYYKEMYSQKNVGV